MSRRLSSLHARAICHATEDSARVELALRNVVGDAPIERSETEGHFGNTIEVLESSVEDEACILDMLRRIGPGALVEIESTLDIRMDGSCHVFLRLDKQRAYSGRLELSDGEDVIAVRIKVRSFPAKVDIAAEVMRSVLEELSSEPHNGTRGAE